MTKKSAETGTAPAFQEVEVRRVETRDNGILTVKFERLKVLREHVKITQDEGDAINRGRFDHSGNIIFVVYLLAGQEAEDIIINPKS